MIRMVAVFEQIVKTLQFDSGEIDKNLATATKTSLNQIVRSHFGRRVHENIPSYTNVHIRLTKLSLPKHRAITRLSWHNCATNWRPV